MHDAATKPYSFQTSALQRSELLALSFDRLILRGRVPGIRGWVFQRKNLVVKRKVLGPELVTVHFQSDAVD